MLLKRDPKRAEEYIWSKAKKHINDALKIVNADITFENEDLFLREGGVLLVGNHQSLFDPLYLIAKMSRNIIPVAKIELKKLPIISTTMEKIGSLFMDRENPREGLKVINAAADYLKEGKAVLIFPEGTRSKNGKLLDFHKGSFKAAQKSDAYIQPFVIEHSDLYKGELKPIKLNQNVLIRFLKPFKYSDLTKEEIKNIDEYVKNIIEKELKNIRQE